MIKHRLLGATAAALCASGLASAQLTLTPQNATPDYRISTDSSTFSRSFWFCGTRSSGSSHFRWSSGSRSLAMTSTGTARLRGTIYNVRNSRQVFTVDVALGGWVAPGKTPPSGSPNTKGLRSTAFIGNGGPIDVKTWGYWTQMTGTLTGTGSLTGYKLSIARTSSSVQIGRGANLKNSKFGFSSWFTVKTLSRGSGFEPGACGDINSNVTWSNRRPPAPGPKGCIAYYPFDYLSSYSKDLEVCSNASRIGAGTRAYLVKPGDVWLKGSDWTATSRTSSNYGRQYFQIIVSPKTGKNCSLTELCIDFCRDNTSPIRHVDIRFDEDLGSGGDNFRTVLRTQALPRTTFAESWERVCIKLGDLTKLQKFSKPLALRFYLYGRRTAGSRNGTTMLDNICLKGTCEGTSRDCLAEYTFTRGSRSSSDKDDCSVAAPVVFGRTTPISSTSGFAIMRDEDWAVSSSRTASVSSRAYIEVKIKPNAGKVCDLDQICLDLARNKYAVSKVLDVRYDEDPGSGGNNFRSVIRSLVLPDLSTTSRSFRRYCLSLSAMPNIEKETRIRIYIWGRSRFSTRNDTYVDNICLEGECKDKVPQIKSIDRTSLPIVTSRCFTIKGCGFTNVTEVRLGTMVFKSKDPCDYGKGYFVVRNDEEMCFYPPLCKPGTFGLVLRDKNGRSSNVARVSLVTPSTFTMAAASRWDVRKPQTVWLYGKFKKPYYCVFASPFLSRSKVDGIIDLGIGANFSLLIPWDGPGPTCYGWTLGTWPPVVKGRTIYFQTLVIDLDNPFVLPFRVTNVVSTRLF